MSCFPLFFKRLKGLHEPAVDDILYFEGEASAQLNRPFVKNTCVVSEIENQQVSAPGLERFQFSSFQCRHEVVQKHRVLSNGKNTHFVKGPLFNKDNP